MEVTKIETCSVKTWLQRYSQAWRSYELLLERLIVAEAVAHSPKSAIPDGMPRGSGNPVDALGSTVAKLEKLRSQVSAAKSKADSIGLEIEAAIAQIGGARCVEKRVLLEMKYLDLMEWGDINRALFREKSDFLLREDSYQRRTFYIHADALKKLGDILDAQKPAEAATRSDDKN